MEKTPIEKFEPLLNTITGRGLPDRYDIMHNIGILTIRLHYGMGTKVFRLHQTTDEDMKYLFYILSTD